MEKEFVPYELAVKLKELGFDEECLTKWGVTSLRLYTDYKSCHNKDDIVMSGDFVSAPLWQQVARFLSVSSNNQINITINGKDDYEVLFKKFEKAIKYLRDL